MSQKISKVAVIGAGTMGAAIAAHVANAGLPVLLLDIPPAELTPEEEAIGLSPDNPTVRNRIVQAGFERICKARPAAFMSKTAQQLVELGNTEDNLNQLADADWIIEVIIEKLEPKHALFSRIEKIRKPGSFVSSNTSGLPIESLAQGRSENFKQHFLGTHFFNPPRYMKLVEIIPTPTTSPAVLQIITTFIEERLGKGVVLCKDTPNFIGNRLYTISFSFAMQYALENGYTVEQVDTLTGPLLGRPKTATFRLLNLVGIDVAAHIAHNLYPLIPNDPYRDILRTPQLETVLGNMVERGWLGNKSGQGFYKKDKDEQGRRVFKILNLDTLDYDLPQKPRFDSVSAVRKIEDTGARLTALFEHDDRAAQFAWALISTDLAYAAVTAPEIAHSLKSVDDAIRWGFNFELGPFQLWDALGVEQTAAKMEAAGQGVAPWVKEMLANGCPTFYKTDNGQVVGTYDWDSKGYVPLPDTPKIINLPSLPIVEQNGSANLRDMGDGVLLLEFTSKMNSLDQDLFSMLENACTRLKQDDEVVGLIIGNNGTNFSVGANLFLLGVTSQQGQFDQIEGMAKSLQDTLTSFQYGPKPVIVAVHQRALAGGAEIVLGASRVVAHAESYIGLVEPGVGLVPAAGGVTAFVRDTLSPAMQVPRGQHVDPLPLAQQILETIGLTKVGLSAAESGELGYLGPQDRIIMNRDHLLHEAKQELLAMVAAGYTPPPRPKLYAGGRDLLAALKMGLWTMQQSGYISEHDCLVGEKLAWVIAGGDLSAPQWLPEQHFLDLERQAFIKLAQTEKTQARIWHMLEKGKPLRN